ncbi:MAG: hypothetical protein IKD19_07375, partial [Prevotella sp.]|nr:hypothetical protein [Prevotella sp.]
LQLNYMVSKTVSTTQRVWNANLRKFVDKTVSKIVTETTNIANWQVSGQDGYYHTAIATVLLSMRSHLLVFVSTS